MEITYGKFYSRNLGRDMEYKVYGSGGKPVLVLPCQGGKFYEFEDFGMLRVYAPYIEDGRIQVFTVDSIDYETLFAQGDPRARTERHEAWMRYLIEEAVPHFSHINTMRNGWEIRFLVTGLSLGALHAASLFFRFPDVFDSLLSLSGIYSMEYIFGGYSDDITYNNSPQQFVANMPEDHPYIQKYNKNRIILCVGRGAWENETLHSTSVFASVLERKHIHAWVDFWGTDSRHDWDWWFKQVEYFLPRILQY